MIFLFLAFYTRLLELWTVKDRVRWELCYKFWRMVLCCAMGWEFGRRCGLPRYLKAQVLHQTWLHKFMESLKHASRRLTIAGTAHILKLPPGISFENTVQCFGDLFSTYSRVQLSMQVSTPPLNLTWLETRDLLLVQVGIYGRPGGLGLSLHVSRFSNALQVRTGNIRMNWKGPLESHLLQCGRLSLLSDGMPAQWSC